jgi:hypothetical protein
MLFYRKKHVMADVGFGLTNKISWSAPAVAQHTRPRALGSFRNGYSPLVAIAPQVLQRRRGAAVAAAQFAQGCDGRSPAPGPAPSMQLLIGFMEPAASHGRRLVAVHQATHEMYRATRCVRIHHSPCNNALPGVPCESWHVAPQGPMPLRYAGKNLAHVLAASRA